MLEDNWDIYQKFPLTPDEETRRAIRSQSVAGDRNRVRGEAAERTIKNLQAPKDVESEGSETSSESGEQAPETDSSGITVLSGGRGRMNRGPAQEEEQEPQGPPRIDEFMERVRPRYEQQVKKASKQLDTAEQRNELRQRAREQAQKEANIRAGLVHMNEETPFGASEEEVKEMSAQEVLKTASAELSRLSVYRRRMEDAPEQGEARRRFAQEQVTDIQNMGEDQLEAVQGAQSAREYLKRLENEGFGTDFDENISSAKNSNIRLGLRQIDKQREEGDKEQIRNTIDSQDEKSDRDLAREYALRETLRNSKLVNLEDYENATAKELAETAVEKGVYSDEEELNEQLDKRAREIEARGAEQIVKEASEASREHSNKKGVEEFNAETERRERAKQRAETLMKEGEEYRRQEEQMEAGQEIRDKRQRQEQARERKEKLLKTQFAAGGKLLEEEKGLTVGVADDWKQQTKNLAMRNIAEKHLGVDTEKLNEANKEQLNQLLKDKREKIAESRGRETMTDEELNQMVQQEREQIRRAGARQIEARKQYMSDTPRPTTDTYSEKSGGTFGQVFRRSFSRGLDHHLGQSAPGTDESSGTETGLMTPEAMRERAQEIGMDMSRNTQARLEQAQQSEAKLNEYDEETKEEIEELRQQIKEVAQKLKGVES